MLLIVMLLQIAFNVYVYAYTFDMCNNKVYLLTYLKYGSPNSVRKLIVILLHKL